MSNEGGWIVTANKKYFCHDGKDGSCFDNYCVLKLKQQKENTMYDKSKGKSKLTAKQKTLPSALKKKIMNSKSKKKGKK